MKHLILLLAISTILFSCQTKEAAEYNKGINIIPQPNEITIVAGEHFQLEKNTTLSANTKEEKTIAEFFAAKLGAATGYDLSVTEGKAKIELRIDSTLDTKKEGYTLSVTNKKVIATGKDAEGLFYAMQSFMQLLPAEITSGKRVSGTAWTAPCVEIKDAPRFEYRGIMLDPGRHFLPVDFVKKQLDILAMFKINRMHWHLTEDQGWRVEIKKYPRLTEIGSVRTMGDGTTHSGFYTQEEIKEVVAYAAERKITIIPEFELPGHELAAIAAYPELSCKGEPTTPRFVWGVEDVVMCPAKAITFEFIEDIINEMVPLFPGEYFHIGGDECPKVSWANCDRCQAFIHKNGLQTKDGHTAEERLQSYVIRRAEEMLATRGKKLIGWDEILEGGLSPNATVMSWRGEEGGIAAAMQGHDVIMSPSNKGVYINFFQGESRIEPVSIGGDAKMSTTYAYDPVPKKLVENRKCGHIVGVQANLWGEYIYTLELTEYQLYPSACTLAEIAWTEVEEKNFEDFNRRVNNTYVRLDQYDINYHLPLPEQPFGSTNYVAFVDSTTVEFTTSRPIKMVYTVDGTEPTPSSTTYTEALHFTESATLKIRSVLPSGKMSRVRTITIDKQIYAPAVEVAGAKHGLRMTSTPGMYLNMAAFAKTTEQALAERIVARPKDVVNASKVGCSGRNLNQAANVAIGYLDIPADGVYHFWTNHNEFWIDGKLLISNDNEVKRYSRNSSSVALAKGLHPIKIVWLGHILGGWPSNWDDGSIMMRESKEEKERMITTKQLFHTK